MQSLHFFKAHVHETGVVKNIGVLKAAPMATIKTSYERVGICKMMNQSHPKAINMHSTQIECITQDCTQLRRADRVNDVTDVSESVFGMMAVI